MSTTDVRRNDANGTTSIGNVDMKLEVVVIPVSDVDRSKEFYGRGNSWLLQEVTTRLPAASMRT